MIVRGDFSRYAWLYFISQTFDATDAFKQLLADLRVEGIPSEVVVVQSDNGGEFNQGEVGQLCRERNIKQEVTTAGSPEYNGIVERGLIAMIESAALAARIQAPELLPGFDIPEKQSLWAEAMSWACDAYNQTATVANPRNRSRHEMFYGDIPQNSSIPILKPEYCKYKRMNKIDPKVRECFYLGPVRNHKRE